MTAFSYRVINRRLVLVLMGSSMMVPPVAAVTGEDTRFQALSKRWLEDFVSTQPVTATQIGDHRFDGEIDDMSAAGRARRTVLWRALLEELSRLDRTKLSRDNQVDAAILSSQLQSMIWDDQRLQSWAWDALVWSALAGNSLYVLMARDFAPLAQRLRSATLRMRKLPKLLEQMRAEIAPARVPPIHAATVAKQNDGVMDIVDSMILPQAKTLTAAEQGELKDAANMLRAAMTAHQQWLNKVLVPQAKGDFRIGAKLFDEKLVFTLNSRLTRKEIRGRADTAIRQTRAQMYEVARKALAGQANPLPMPDNPTPAEQQQIIAAALSLASQDRPARDAVVATAKRMLAQATDFVRRKDLISLPDAPVDLIIMPKFQQGVAVAYCDSPGPLDKALKAFYAVSPIPEGWTKAQTDSFLREYSNRGIADITVHEAMPGHYVQLWHSNTYPSPIRAVLGSGSFVEGWAVYAENVMAEEGFYGNDPLYRLVQLKVYLRTISNAILDQAIHCDGMSREDAMRLMTQTAFQEEREAAGKWDRARMSATQLSTYFVGRQEHDGLRAQAERQPGFKLKAYHDQVLSYGSAPTRYVGALMFGGAVT
jgi:uncharacterized protein (DUF885 family)